MSWYKKITKTAAAPLSFYVEKIGDGTVDITFTMSRPGAEFELTTLSPIPDANFSSGLTTDQNTVRTIFEQLYSGKKLTTPKAKRELSRQKRLEERRKLDEEARAEEKRLLDEQQLLEDQKPKQMELNFSSNRSKLVHKKARTNKIKGGKGDELDVKDVDKKQLIMGIDVELEHVGKGVNISNDLITKFVENELQGINETLPHQEILEKSQDIVMDHLFEIDDYYTRLAIMEKEAEDKPNEKTKSTDVPDNTE